MNKDRELPSKAMRELGERLTNVRKRIQKENTDITSQETFAQFLGIGSSTGASKQKRMSDLERGNAEPTIEELKAYSDKCGVSIDWIVTGKEYKESRVTSEKKEPLYSDIIECIIRLRKMTGMKVIYQDDGNGVISYGLNNKINGEMKTDLIRNKLYMPLILSGIFLRWSKCDLLSKDSFMKELVETWEKKLLEDASHYTISGKLVGDSPEDGIMKDIWKEIEKVRSNLESIQNRHLEGGLIPTAQLSDMFKNYKRTSIT